MHHHTLRLIQVFPECSDGVFTAAGRRLQQIMRDPEVVTLVTLPWAPSMLKDPRYTDVMVIWDHGEGPHCPESFQPDTWRTNHVLPPVLWNYVSELAKTLGVTDQYCAFWLRSEEVGMCGDAEDDYGTQEDGAQQEALGEDSVPGVPTGPLALLQLAKRLGVTIVVDDDQSFVIHAGMKASKNSNCAEGLRCPSCDNEERFHITGSMVLEVTDDGAEPVECADWDDDALCRCPECGFHGRVADLRCPTAAEWVTPQDPSAG